MYIIEKNNKKIPLNFIDNKKDKLIIFVSGLEINPTPKSDVAGLKVAIRDTFATWMNKKSDYLAFNFFALSLDNNNLENTLISSFVDELDEVIKWAFDKKTYKSVSFITQSFGSVVLSGWLLKNSELPFFINKIYFTGSIFETYEMHVRHRFSNKNRSIGRLREENSENTYEHYKLKNAFPNDRKTFVDLILSLKNKGTEIEFYLGEKDNDYMRNVSESISKQTMSNLIIIENGGHLPWFVGDFDKLKELYSTDQAKYIENKRKLEIKQIKRFLKKAKLNKILQF